MDIYRGANRIFDRRAFLIRTSVRVFAGNRVAGCFLGFGAIPLQLRGLGRSVNVASYYASGPGRVEVGAEFPGLRAFIPGPRVQRFATLNASCLRDRARFRFADRRRGFWFG